MCCYSDAVEELIQWSSSYVVETNADTIEYDDPVSISMTVTQATIPDELPSKKRSKTTEISGDYYSINRIGFVGTS